MTKEERQIFTRRIVSSNKSELVVVLYDIFASYVASAKLGYQNGKRGDADSKEAIYHALDVLIHLKDDLHFSKETAKLSSNLYSIYDYCQRLLYKTMSLGRLKELEEAEWIMNELGEAFREVAKEDSSKPMMENAQRVTAGFTYGRTDVNETDVLLDNSRGFFV